MSERQRRGYDRLAKWYETIEKLRFGNQLQRWRTRLIEELPVARDVLFVGDGDGRLLEAYCQYVVRSNCPVQLTSILSIDISPEMLRLQQARLAPLLAAPDISQRLQLDYLSADIRALEPAQLRTSRDAAGQFDLVVTPFVLDSFSDKELISVVEKIAAVVAPGGRWYVVDFKRPSCGFSFLWAEFWLACMHLFFRITTGLRRWRLADYPGAITSLGFELQHQEVSRWGWITAILYRKPINHNDRRQTVDHCEMEPGTEKSTFRRT